MNNFFNINELILYLEQKRSEGYDFVKFENSYDEILKANTLGVFLKKDLNTLEQTYNVGDIDYVKQNM